MRVWDYKKWKGLNKRRKGKKHHRGEWFWAYLSVKTPVPVLFDPRLDQPIVWRVHRQHIPILASEDVHLWHGQLTRIAPEHFDTGFHCYVNICWSLQHFLVSHTVVFQASRGLIFQVPLPDGPGSWVGFRCCSFEVGSISRALFNVEAVAIQGQ